MSLATIADAFFGLFNYWIVIVLMMIGFYIGGMGAKNRNFHKELLARSGLTSPQAPSPV